MEKEFDNKHTESILITMSYQKDIKGKPEWKSVKNVTWDHIFYFVVGTSI